NNLSVQENRLRRQKEKDLPALKELQEARLDRAAREYFKALTENRHKEFDPAPFGFEFSSEQIGHIKRRAMALYPNTYVKYLSRPVNAAYFSVGRRRPALPEQNPDCQGGVKLTAAPICATRKIVRNRLTALLWALIS